MSKTKWGAEARPKTICAIDASTNSLAFALFVDNDLSSIGKIHFDGNNTYEKVMDAGKKVKAFFDIYGGFEAIVIGRAPEHSHGIKLFNVATKREITRRTFKVIGDCLHMHSFNSEAIADYKEFACEVFNVHNPITNERLGYMIHYINKDVFRCFFDRNYIGFVHVVL